MFPHVENAEKYGLATYDISVADKLEKELPLVAAAYVITEQPQFRDCLVRQIDESHDIIFI